MNQTIKFNFQPKQNDVNKSWGVEKEDSGKIKRRYLEGISSGSKFDGDMERMTEHCIQSFMRQAESGQVLLYNDIHGIKASEDIGIMVHAEVMPDGNWFTSYRLFDESDGVGQAKLDIIENVWKQANGFPPYKIPLQKGFSIEGDIPDDGIISAETDEQGNVSKRVMNEVILTGVVLVPKPAYTDSVAVAVYKALGETTPKKSKSLKKSFDEEFSSVLQDQVQEDSYQRNRWELSDALERTIQKVMQKKNITDKVSQLSIAFDSYKNHMIPKIMEAESVFMGNEDIDDVSDDVYLVKENSEQPELITKFIDSVAKVKSILNSGNENEKQSQ